MASSETADTNANTAPAAASATTEPVARGRDAVRAAIVAEQQAK
jgi:hypothetical protein